jgi:hypothetical protein
MIDGKATAAAALPNERFRKLLRETVAMTIPPFSLCPQFNQNGDRCAMPEIGKMCKTVLAVTLPLPYDNHHLRMV